MRLDQFRPQGWNGVNCPPVSMVGRVGPSGLGLRYLNAFSALKSLFAGHAQAFKAGWGQAGVLVPFGASEEILFRTLKSFGHCRDNRGIVGDTRCQGL